MAKSQYGAAMGAAACLAVSLAASATSAQLAPPAPSTTGQAPVTVRDGDAPWTVRRDPDDRSRVVAASPGGGILRAHVDEHALVRVAAGLDARRVLRSLDVVPVREVAPALGVWRVVDARGGDGLDLAARLAERSGPGRPLLDAIPDWIVAHRSHAIAIPPNDTRYDGQWYLDRMGIEDAWRLSIGDPSTTIVVVDTGCDAMHVDLFPNLDPGRDVIDMDDDPTPTGDTAGDAHGTACAGLAAAATDNGEGIAGTCPECRLRCVRLLDGGASELPISADVAAFQFVLDVDAAVVSNSWGFVDPTPVPDMLRSIIESVVDDGRGGLGALVLFAAGNDDRELFDYEIEAVRGVVTVGAVNNFDEATSFSNRGAPVDVVAPTGTLTTDISGAGGQDPGDYTNAFGGTSSACPVAAGVAGLLASAAPDRTGAEIADALVATALPSPFATPDATGHDDVYGYGRIDPAAALRIVLDVPAPDGGVDADAGPMPDAGAGAPDAGGDGEGAGDGGCGCRPVPARGHAGLGVSLAAIALVAWRRRRRHSG